MDEQLTGKVAVVIGGGGGIGAAIAVLFAQEGADVAVLDRNEPNATAVAEQCKSSGGRATALAVDVTDGEAVRAAMDRIVEELGGISMPVQPARVLQAKPPPPTTEAPVDQVLAAGP